MRLATNYSPIFLLLALAAGPAVSQSVISSPTNGEAVWTPFTLATSASTCSSEPVNYVGYSLDNSTTTQTFAGQTMNGPVNAPYGWHIVHVKAWNIYGGVCDNDVSVDVTGSNATSVVVPASAASISNIQTLGGWTAIHDGGTPGWSVGALTVVGSPSLSGAAGFFANEFSDFGGERYAAQIGNNTTAQNFFYDAWVYISESAAGFSNLEFDLNQTMPSGETVIMGFQCDTWNNTWDYAVNAGSPTDYNDTWGHTNASCNVHNWVPNMWHHVQIYSSHAENGWVTYNAVWLDGVEQDLNITVFSGFDLGWGPAITTQFQIDGDSAGTTWGNVYLDDMTVYYW
jgi:hypothetical protein